MPVRSLTYKMIEWIPYKAIPTLEGYLMSIVLSIRLRPIEQSRSPILPTKGCGNSANVHDNSWRHDTLVGFVGVSPAYCSFLVFILLFVFFHVSSCAGKPIIYNPCICARLRYANLRHPIPTQLICVFDLPFGPSTPSHLVLSSLEGNCF